jgi:hypothetical protein
MGVGLLAKGGVRHCDVASKSSLLEGRHAGLGEISAGREVRGIAVDEGEGDDAPRVNAMKTRTMRRSVSWAIPSRFSRTT